MFPFRKKNDQPQTRTPVVPETEAGKTAHRVVVGGDVAYVFTNAAKLCDATFSPANVAFVNPDCGAGNEHHDVDAGTLDEAGGDFDHHAAQKCAAMNNDGDKVVVFATPDRETKIVAALCRQFGSKASPASVLENEAQQPEPSAGFNYVEPERKGPVTHYLCG